MTGKLAVIFDLDGTLIDSAPDLRAALNRVLAQRGLPGVSAQALRPMIGDGTKILVERAWAAFGKTAQPADHAEFLDDYEANATVETVVYPGIPTALAALADAGHRLAICTNKPVGPASIILEKLALREFFAVVTGGDSTAFRKPDPRHLEGTLKALGQTHAVMIGDHENDMNAARGLGLPSIFVSWGYGQAEGSFTAHEPQALPGIIAGIPPAA